MFGHIVYVFSGYFKQIGWIQLDAFEELNQIKISASFNWTRIPDSIFMYIYSIHTELYTL